MKYIHRKVIRGEARYYIQYGNHSKYIGPFLPADIEQRLLCFFVSLGREKRSKIPEAVKQEFKYGGIEGLEEVHYWHIAINHELFQKDHNEFYNEFINLYTYHSNRSEGSKTTKKEIDQFASKKIRSPKTKTEQEIFNSFQAFNFAISDDMKWNIKSIKHIHGILLDSLDPMIAGKWKNEDNIINNQTTTGWKDVSRAMKDLIEWLKAEFKKKTYPPKIALHFYVRFEHIHPFLDGNGRVGRILLNAILHKYNYPPIVFFSENHQEHCAAMTQAIEGRWTKMNKHFLKQVKKTENAVMNKIAVKYMKN